MQHFVGLKKLFADNELHDIEVDEEGLVADMTDEEEMGAMYDTLNDRRMAKHGLNENAIESLRRDVIGNNFVRH